MANGQRNRLSGLNPLAYCGVDPTSPPQLLIETRAPTVHDIARYSIGTLWVMQNPKMIWMLVSIVNNDAQWCPLFPAGAAGVETFHTDVGDALSVASVINVFGGTNINTAGAGQDVTVNLNDNVVLAGTLDVADFAAFDNSVRMKKELEADGDVYFTNLASASDIDLLTINIVGKIGTIGSVTNGEILIASDAGPIKWANITAVDGSLSVGNGENIIDLQLKRGGNAGDVLTSPGGGGKATWQPGGGGGTPVAFFAHFPQATNGPYVATYPPQVTNQIGSKGNPWTILYDTTGGFNAAGVFTAPSTGLWHLGMSISYNVPWSPALNYPPEISFLVGATTWYCSPWANITASTNQGTPTTSFSMIFNLTSGDTVIPQIQITAVNVPGGFNIVGAAYGGIGIERSWIWGYKL